jgi:hypothetical protein
MGLINTRLTQEEKKQRAKIILWCILAIAFARKIEIPEWNDILVGMYNGVPFTLNNFIWFIGNDLIIVLFALIVFLFVDGFVMTIVFGLAIGKTVDEFSCPFNFGAAEAIWDVGVVLYAIKRMLRK